MQMKKPYQSIWRPPAAAPSHWAGGLIPDETAVPEWEQPESAKSYRKGDKVVWRGAAWERTVDKTNWEPGIYGWEEIT